jgi:hypothetical protein
MGPTELSDQRNWNPRNLLTGVKHPRHVTWNLLMCIAPKVAVVVLIVVSLDTSDFGHAQSAHQRSFGRCFGHCFSTSIDSTIYSRPLCSTWYDAVL